MSSITDYFEKYLLEARKNPRSKTSAILMWLMMTAGAIFSLLSHQRN